MATFPLLLRVTAADSFFAFHSNEDRFRRSQPDWKRVAEMFQCQQKRTKSIRLYNLYAKGGRECLVGRTVISGCRRRLVAKCEAIGVAEAKKNLQRCYRGCSGNGIGGEKLGA